MTRLTALHRVDKFAVPQAARAAFLEVVALTHGVLRTQPGFVRDTVLEQVSGPGAFNFVTIVEWESEEAMANAVPAVQARHREVGFDRAAFIEGHGIRPDIGNYRVVEF